MQQMGLQARLMSQALRKMSGNASKAGCTLMFLNQIRYKVWYINFYLIVHYLYFIRSFDVFDMSIDWSILWESWSHQWRDSFEILCISPPRDTAHWEDKICKIYEVNSIFAEGFTWQCLLFCSRPREMKMLVWRFVSECRRARYVKEKPCFLLCIMLNLSYSRHDSFFLLSSLLGL
jgi:hypothetical protein